MEKRLFRVKVVLYVMAENESDARVAATNARFDIFECTARKAEYVDPAWINSIPYNADDERTCAQIFAASRQTVQSPVPFPTEARRVSRMYTRHPASFMNS